MTEPASAKLSALRDQVMRVEGNALKRCAICGFMVDTALAPEKPSVDFSTAGRGKQPSIKYAHAAGYAEGWAAACQKMAEWCDDHIAARADWNDWNYALEQAAARARALAKEPQHD